MACSSSEQMVQIAAAAHRAGRGGNLSVSIIKNPRPKDHALLLHLNAKLPKICGGFLCINSCKWAKKILQTGKALGTNHKEPFFAVTRRRACRYGGLDFIRSCGGHGDKKSRVPLSESGARPFWKRKSFFCWEYQYEDEGERGRAQGSSTLPRKFRGITSSGCRRPPRKRQGHPPAGLQ